MWHAVLSDLSRSPLLSLEMTQVEATSPDLHGCAATAVSARLDEAMADSAVCLWRSGGCGSAVRFVGAFTQVL